jgi:hypothetical protein
VYDFDCDMLSRLDLVAAVAVVVVADVLVDRGLGDNLPNTLRKSILEEEVSNVGGFDDGDGDGDDGVGTRSVSIADRLWFLPNSIDLPSFSRENEEKELADLMSRLLLVSDTGAFWACSEVSVKAAFSNWLRLFWRILEILSEALLGDEDEVLLNTFVTFLREAAAVEDVVM